MIRNDKYNKYLDLIYPLSLILLMAYFHLLASLLNQLEINYIHYLWIKNSTLIVSHLSRVNITIEDSEQDKN